MATYKLKDFAKDISVAIKDAQSSPLKRFVGLEHYDSGEPVITRFTDTSLITSSVKEFHENDILIARRNVYLRRAGIAFFSGLTSGDSIILRIYDDCEEKTGIPKEDAIKIIPFILNSNNFWNYANKHADGMNSKRISKEMLYDYEFDLPSLAEQKILADKLWAAYRLKESYKKLLAATDEMVKSQFIEIFGTYKANTPWSQVLTITNGKAYPEEYQESGTYPICGSAGIMYYGEKKLCNANTIILGRKGNINSPIYMESDYWIVDTAFSLDVNKDVLHPKFFYYWCCQYDFTKLNKQGVLPSLTRKDLEKLEMAIPPMEEQMKFVAIAEQADKSKFVGFKSQFIEMFGNAPKIKLEDYISTQSGGTPNTKKQEYYEGGDIPWLSSGEVNQGYIESTEKFITQKGLENSSAKWVPKDCVVIAMYGATAGKVGYIRIPLTTNQAVCSLLPCSEFNSIFLYYAVSQKSDWMISQCRGAAQPNISQGIIRSMELPLPPMEEQMKFVTIAEQADKSKYYNQVA